MPAGGSNGIETITGWDDRGFPTTRLVNNGWETRAKSFNQQGFEVTAVAGGGSAPTPAAANAASTITAAPAVLKEGGNAVAVKLMATSSSVAAAPKESGNWQRKSLILGIGALVAQRLFV